MDVQHPFADDAARRRLLYRLPLRVAPRRALLLHGAGERCAQGRWPWQMEGAMAMTHDEALRSAAPPTAPYDAVALLQTAPSKGTALLAAAARLLAHDGVLVGSIERTPLRASVGTRAWLRSLRAAGFVDVECYYVYPTLDSPMALVPTESKAARAFFLRTVRSMRGTTGLLGYSLRLTACWLGVYPRQQKPLFYWARKPC